MPIYYLSDIGRLGYLKIINKSSSDLKIYTQNDIPIEDIVVLINQLLDFQLLRIMGEAIITCYRKIIIV